MKYSKFVVALVVAVAGGVSAALTGDQHISSSEMVNIAILGVGALSVYFGPNVAGTALYTKTILAVLTAALTTAASYISDGVSPSEWAQIGIAAVGALGIYVAPSSNP